MVTSTYHLAIRSTFSFIFLLGMRAHAMITMVIPTLVRRHRNEEGLENQYDAGDIESAVPSFARLNTYMARDGA